MREFVIRQAIANCLNMGYGLQIRSQREMCNSHLQCSLIDQILTSGLGILTEQYEQVYFHGDDLWAGLRPRGLPLGNLTSQFWANCYLNPLDQFIKRELKCRAYLRYVDDFLLFADDKARLHEWREAIIAQLATLRLTMHENKAHPQPVSEGIPFLGFVVYPDHRLIKGRKVVAYRQRLKKLWQAYQRGEVEQADVVKSLQGWLAHIHTGDSWGLAQTMLEPMVF